ncbi:MAG: hypothetical protein KTR31_21315 [Myxococcales bacterium]|nr:hypothetical protein [Myxococcales bacterium]
MGPLPQATSFVGRSQELSRITRAVSDGRSLLSVVGPGGVGKSRLAAEASRSVGGLFVDASAARTPRELVGAVADQVLRGDGTVTAQVDAVGRAVAHLAPDAVVLDNLEQAFEAVPGTLGRWMQATPATTWIATSRVPLELPGEEVLRLGPLTTEDAHTLFVAAAPPTAREELQAGDAVVSEVVALLDGLPLALEIAAARLAVLGIGDLLGRLRQDLGLLRDAQTRRSERHRTLMATIRWSWDLLAPDERQALAQASLFAGAFDIDDAEAVLVSGELEPLDAVHRLVHQSLLQVHGDAPGQRQFRMLIPTRVFARQQLAADPEAEACAEGRFSSWVLGRSGRWMERARRGAVDAMRRLQGEGSLDLRAVLERSLERGDAAVALGAVPLLFPALTAHADLPEGARLARAALDLGAPADTPGFAETLRALGLALRVTGRHAEGLEVGRRLVTLGQQLGRDDIEGAGHVAVARCTHHGDRRVRPHWEAAAASTTQRVQSEALGALARIASEEGDAEGAIELARRGLALAEDPRSLVLRESQLALCLQRAGHTAEALESLRRCVELALATGDLRSVCVNATALVELAITQGQYEQAVRDASEALDVARRTGFLGGEAAALCLRAVGRELLRDAAALDDARVCEALLVSLPEPTWSVSISGLMAVVLARADRAAADSMLERARELVSATDLGRLDSGEGPEALLAAAGAAVRAAEPPTSREALARAAVALREALVLAGDGPGDIALLRCVIRHRLAVSGDPDTAVMISRDGSWFDAPEVGRVDVQREAARGVLAALVASWLLKPEAPVDRTTLVDGGWPGERILEQAAANRLRVTLSWLRKAGLPSIEHHASGWRLGLGIDGRPSVVVVEGHS